jgi:hypothetical protein
MRKEEKRKKEGEGVSEEKIIHEQLHSHLCGVPSKIYA